jgi:hypothetical protein
VDSIDGCTPKTLLSISQADIRISKNGGTPAQSHNASGATHKENGYYQITLDTNDTDTTGRLRVMVTVGTALGVKSDYEVISAVPYDALVAGTDNCEVNAVQWNGQAVVAEVNRKPVKIL